MSDYDPLEFDKDIKDLETRLKVLRAEFNQYLAGTIKFPPNFTEAQIRKVIKKYAIVKGLKGLQRFNYFNLVAKFNTMMEFYSRRIRDKQEGRGAYALAKQQEDFSPHLRGKLDEKHIRSHVVADLGKQSNTLKALYDDWNHATARSGSSGPSMDKDKFARMVQTKTDQLIKAKGCDAVRYRISLKDGKVRIKAKPIKKSSES
jgi:hypothetical protein